MRLLSGALGLSLVRGAGAMNACLDPTTACPLGSTHIDVSNCGLTDDDIPDLAGCIDHAGGAIKELSLNNNRLTSAILSWLDDNGQPLLGGMHELERLDLRGNSLGNVPAGAFDRLSALQTLNLFYCGVTSLEDDAFLGLEALVYLGIGLGNSLGHLPAGAFNGLSALRKLQLSYAGVSSQAGTFSGLDSLDELTIFTGALGHVPAGAFNGLAALQTLNLNRAGITSLASDTFEDLESLKKLDLVGNSLGDVPAGAFNGLTALQTLNLSGADITSLEAGTFSGLQALVELGLGGQDASLALPAGLFSPLGALEFLDVCGNDNLECLPSLATKRACS